METLEEVRAKLEKENLKNLIEEHLESMQRCCPQYYSGNAEIPPFGNDYKGKEKFLYHKFELNKLMLENLESCDPLSVKGYITELTKAALASEGNGRAEEAINIIATTMKKVHEQSLLGERYAMSLYAVGTKNLLDIGEDRTDLSRLVYPTIKGLKELDKEGKRWGLRDSIEYVETRQLAPAVSLMPKKRSRSS